MRKRKYLLLVIGIVMVAVGYLYIKRQLFVSARYHLLCETLKPGMSKDDVLSILNQAGKFWMRDTDSPSPNIELHISFTDPKGRKQYGAFDLGFSDYKYDSAYISGFERESVEVICDFSQAAQSITETPRP